jgi:hypothetical protein
MVFGWRMNSGQVADDLFEGVGRRLLELFPVLKDGVRDIFRVSEAA